MSSKLPKPLGFKPFQARPLETVLERPTKVKPKAEEAPPSTTREFNFPASRLKRRSKSAVDLRIKELPLPLNAENVKVPKKPASVKPEVKPKVATGSKRPLANRSDEGASKPKVSKKIPDWDYKSRFAQLNEKYQHAQETMQTMKNKVAQFDEIETNYVRIQQEATTLREANQILKTKADNYDRVSNEHLELQDEHKNLSSLYTQLKTDYNETIQEQEKLRCTYDRVNDAYQKLLVEHEELTSKFTELSVKSGLDGEQITSLLATVESNREDISTLKELCITQKQLLLNFESEKRTLHNLIQDLKGNIRVFCRVRPPLPFESEKLQCGIQFIGETGLEIRKARLNVNQVTGKTQECKAEFVLDRVFSAESRQEEIFEDLAQLVQSALDGYNVCVFAYGQTGSGKTFTMQGTEGSDRGMIPRTVHLIFDNINNLKRTGWEYTVHVSFLEIYNENIRDLLNLRSSHKLDIHFNAGNGTSVTNLTVQSIETASELETLMRLAQNNRATAATNFNEHSSRSHAVTKIHLLGTHKEQNIIYTGSINLVDLAGSECAKQSVNCERLNETKNINKSLATLGDVINALHNKSKHVPYRNSKLTYLLQSCLQGNSKTLMIVNIALFDECYGESINSLRFASKVKEVKTKSKKNKMVLA